MGHIRSQHTGYIRWSPAQRIVFWLEMASCALWEREGFPAYRKKSAHCSRRAKFPGPGMQPSPAATMVGASPRPGFQPV